jgi:hypothetical protein
VLSLGGPQFDFFIPFVLELFLSLLLLMLFLLLSSPAVFFLFFLFSFVPTFFLFVFVGIVLLLVALVVFFLLFFSFLLPVWLFAVSVRPVTASLVVSVLAFAVPLVVPFWPFVVPVWPFAFPFWPFAVSLWPVAVSPVLFILPACGNGGFPSQVVQAVPVAGIRLVAFLKDFVLVFPRLVAVENADFDGRCPVWAASPPRDTSTPRTLVATTIRASSPLRGDEAADRDCPGLPRSISEIGDLCLNNLLRPVQDSGAVFRLGAGSNDRGLALPGVRVWSHPHWRADLTDELFNGRASRSYERSNEVQWHWDLTVLFKGLTRGGSRWSEVPGF